LEIDEDLIKPRVASIIENLPEDPVEAIVAIEFTILIDGYDISQKRVWRAISAAALTSPADRRDEFLKLQNSRIVWLQKVLENLKMRQQVRDDLNCYEAGRLIYAIGRNNFRLYIMNKEMTLMALKIHIRKDIKLLLQGMLA
jgi:hypothetical protein